METKTCTECYSEIPKVASRCKFCGAKQALASARKRPQCPYCKSFKTGARSGGIYLIMIIFLLLALFHWIFLIPAILSFFLGMIFTSIEVFSDKVKWSCLNCKKNFSVSRKDLK